MSDWLLRVASSRHAQLATTAVVSGALVAVSILTFQRARRQRRLDDVKASIPTATEEHIAAKLTQYGAAATSSSTLSEEDERGAAMAARARQGDWDEDLILEQLARNRVFLAPEGLAKLRRSFVVVIGCGGVGSHATAALARSGVARLRLVDFDQVTLSSLNRHAVATLADVGTPKVHCLRRRLEQVAPWVRFDTRVELFSAESAARLLGPATDLDDAPPSGDAQHDGGMPDFVIDAIDNIDTKVALLHHCHRHGLPVISSMGAGCKADPTRVLVGDIAASAEDPLSRVTRRRLRQLGVADGLPVVFSTERPGPGKAELQPVPADAAAAVAAAGHVGDLGVLPDFRVRVLPVLGTMPAFFGLAAANHVLCTLAGYPLDYAASKQRARPYDGVLSALQGCEVRVARAAGEIPHEADGTGLRLPVTLDDVGYVIDEMYRGRSAVSGISSRLVLVRWRRPPKGWVDERVPGLRAVKLALTDLVCVTKEEAGWHEREVLKPGRQPEEVYSEEVVARVRQRVEEEERFEKFR